MRCAGCEETFDPRRDGGKGQRFCSTEHRRAFDRAGRAWLL
jgi:hypothetical protein